MTADAAIAQVGHALRVAAAQDADAGWKADYERRCKARDTHPNFATYLAASGHLITAQETRLIKATAMSVGQI